MSDFCLFVITPIDEELTPSRQPARLLGSADLQEVHSGAETVFPPLPSGGPRPALWDPRRRVQRLLWREALEGSLRVLSPQKAPPAQPPLCPVSGTFHVPSCPCPCANVPGLLWSQGLALAGRAMAPHQSRPSKRLLPPFSFALCRCPACRFRYALCVCTRSALSWNAHTHYFSTWLTPAPPLRLSDTPPPPGSLP